MHGDAVELNRRSTYPRISALALPTPTTLGAGPVNGWIANALGSRPYNAALNIDNDEPVPTSAAAIRTSSITAFANS